MSLSRISDARAKRRVRAMRALKKKIQEEHPTNVIQAFEAVGVEQEPGRVMLKCYGDLEKTKLLGVTLLNEQGIKDLNENLRSAAGLKSGLIWTP